MKDILFQRSVNFWIEPVLVISQVRQMRKTLYMYDWWMTKSIEAVNLIEDYFHHAHV
jgi:hypothetical protein